LAIQHRGDLGEALKIQLVQPHAVELHANLRFNSAQSIVPLFPTVSYSRIISATFFKTALTSFNTPIPSAVIVSLPDSNNTRSTTVLVRRSRLAER